MAHFARIEPETDTVCEVIVVGDEQMQGKDDLEHEELGLAYIEAIGLAGTWVQTSYTASFRGAFAGVGMTWDGTNFRAPGTTDQPEEAPSA